MENSTALQTDLLGMTRRIERFIRDTELTPRDLPLAQIKSMLESLNRVVYKAQSRDSKR